MTDEFSGHSIPLLPHRNKNNKLSATGTPPVRGIFSRKPVLVQPLGTPIRLRTQHLLDIDRQVAR